MVEATTDQQAATQQDDEWNMADTIYDGEIEEEDSDEQAQDRAVQQEEVSALPTPVPASPTNSEEVKADHLSFRTDQSEVVNQSAT